MKNSYLSEPDSRTKNFKIALIGECMIELQENSNKRLQQTFGGDTLNTAIYMARVGNSLPLTVDYVTALGTDPFSQAMMRFWEKENVGSSMVQCIKGKLPGLYYIQLDPDGERSFHYWRGESAARQCFQYEGSDRILARLGDYDGIYLSGISLAILEPVSLERLIARLYTLRTRSTSICFDCNFRPHLWPSKADALETYARIFSMASTVLISRDEGRELLDCSGFSDIHGRLAGSGVKESVIRDGKGPCSIYHNEITVEVLAKPVPKVVDTTAAGDSFSAAYLTARIFGCDPRVAAEKAHCLAAGVIACKGAVAPVSAMPFQKGFLTDEELSG